MDGMGDPGATASADKVASRRRLAGFVSAEAYRPDLLSRIARISMELRETAQAGRYWLLSDAVGPEVDAAVDAFVKSCQATPRLIASELGHSIHFEIPQIAAFDGTIRGETIEGTFSDGNGGGPVPAASRGMRSARWTTGPDAICFAARRSSLARRCSADARRLRPVHRHLAR